MNTVTPEHCLKFAWESPFDEDAAEKWAQEHLHEYPLALRLLEEQPLTPIESQWAQENVGIEYNTPAQGLLAWLCENTGSKYPYMHLPESGAMHQLAAALENCAKALNYEL